MSAREDFLSHGWCSARGVLDSQSVGDARENVARYVSDVVPEIDSSFTYFEDRGASGPSPTSWTYVI